MHQTKGRSAALHTLGSNHSINPDSDCHVDCHSHELDVVGTRLEFGIRIKLCPHLDSDLWHFVQLHQVLDGWSWLRSIEVASTIDEG